MAALAALAAGWPTQALAESTTVSGHRRRAIFARGLTWQKFTEQMVVAADQLVNSPKPNEASYLRWLRSLVSRLTAFPDAPFPPHPDVASASCFDRFPVSVVQFKLEPWAVIPYHDHREYNGVLCAIAGEVYVRSFKIVGNKAATGGSFLIRQTREERLSDGSCSSLSRTKNNIHHVRAGPHGARLVDFFTFFRWDGRSVYINAKRRGDLGPNMYEANWIE